MTELSFKEIREKLNSLKLPQFDVVVGVANGGIVPGCMVAMKLSCDFKVIRIKYRDEKNDPAYPEPVLFGRIELPEGATEILIVDDVSVSGKTLNTAKALLRTYHVKTLVFKGKADYVLFPEVEPCVNWPWKVT